MKGEGVNGSANIRIILYTSVFDCTHWIFHRYSNIDYLVTVSDIPLVMIAQNAVAGVDSFPLLAIPFFMLAGNLMSGGGIAKEYWILQKNV